MRFAVVLLTALLATPAWAGVSVKADSNGVKVDSDAATFLNCAGGSAYVFQVGHFAVISKDDAPGPVCIDYRAGRLHNFSGGNQAADCREHVKSDVALCAGPFACGDTLQPVDLGACW